MKTYGLDFVERMIGAKKVPIHQLMKGEKLDSEKVKESFEIKRPEDEMGVYVFWWEEGVAKLPPTHPLCLIGPKMKERKRILEQTEFDGHPIYPVVWDKQDFPPTCKTLFPLYIGKTTVFCNRISQHLALGSTKGWLNRGKDRAEKNKLSRDRNLLIKHTTSCQFRSGFEHLWGYKDHETTMELLKQVSVSFFPIHSKDKSNRWDIKARFYLEDLAVGYYRPWFNVDSER